MQCYPLTAEAPEKHAPQIQYKLEIIRADSEVAFITRTCWQFFLKYAI